ncbi:MULTISPECIES: hypothetical protein [unclassified Mesorhizobium]|uniref:hypothetical protein n=1 Tax=unclassified Mesorhizobium TaxID=325217 RepID=UPI000FCA00B5|nr:MULTISPECIES: hypothetical protein [unclassified Mesorhizobium]RUX97155.1 hypothetical protein EN993_04995 [Mesorhizobium sp. M7D.F.Ca.US.004.01.2.1]RVA28289.1 hypothetical protein EN935_18855 [Mesorhizobium sp. M7D.F.Ca.US.004.03.1.1]
MTSEKPFKYTFDQLAAIADTLDVDEDHHDCRYVERVVGEWKAYTEDDVRAELARNAKIADLAEQLLDELEPENDFDIDEHFSEGKPATLVGHLVSLLNFVEQVSDLHPPRKGRRPQIPSALSARLIEFWENSGRRVSRSSKVDDETDEQTPSGPLVRFLLASCSPILAPPPTADAAASAIRTYQKASGEHGEMATEEQVISAIVTDRTH